MEITNNITSNYMQNEHKKRKLDSTQTELFYPNNEENDFNSARTPIFSIDKSISKALSDVVSNITSTTISSKDIKKVYFCLLRTPSDGPNWFSIENKRNISHTVLISIDNFSLKYLKKNIKSLPFIENNFQNFIEFDSSHETNLYQELCKEEDLFNISKTPQLTVDTSSISIAPSDYKSSCEKELVADSKRGDKFPRTELLLNYIQLLKEGFPLFEEHYVFTKEKYEPVTLQSPMFGLDCEMCDTSAYVKELTRVSVVDEDGKVLFDSLVKPRNKITNYLTRYSGITKAMLDPINVRLEDVHKKLVELLPPDAILCGHSLNFDLHALKMIHPYCIDTSVIYNVSGYARQKTKLKTLSADYLGIKIQEGHAGHDPIEDSMASLKLVQLKLANSPQFVNVALEQNRKSYNWKINSDKFNSQNIFELISYRKETVQYFGRDNYDFFPKNVKKSTKTSNKKLLKTAQGNIMNTNFSFCQLKLDEKSEAQILRINKTIEELFNNSFSSALFLIVFTGTAKHNGAVFAKIKT